MFQASTGDTTSCRGLEVSALNSIPNLSEIAGRAFCDPLEHLKAELRRLDLLLHREILRLRISYQLSLDEFRGLYISDEQVDRLVHQAVETENNGDVIATLTERAESLRIENRKRALPEFPWCRLAEIFRLSPDEQDLLLIAIAPELDLKYETLYAYLNNDVTRKWATCELAVRLLASSPGERISHRSLLSPRATLFEHAILRWIAPAIDRPRWLGGGISVAHVVINYLLDQPGVEHELASLAKFYVPERSWCDVPIHASTERELRNLSRHTNQLEGAATPRILLFEGRVGSSRRQAGEALARDLNAPMLSVDLQAARALG